MLSLERALSAGTPANLVQRLRQAAHTAAAVLAHAPENAAYGLTAFAPLGIQFGPAAMAMALLGAVVANGVASALGGGRLVGGPRASLALLTAALVAALVPLWGNDGSAAWRIVGLVGLGVVGAGLLQAAFGLTRLGDIAKYTPYPVRVGLTAGIGLLLAATALPVLLGHGFGSRWAAALQAPLWPAAAVGGCAALIASLAMRRNTRVPAVLLGLAAGALLHAALDRSMWAPQLGHLIATPDFPPPLAQALQLALWGPLPDDLPLRPTLDLLATYALTAAVLCSLDTLLATSIVDGRLRRSRDANRELVAQGVANAAAALLGGQPTSPSVPRSLALLQPSAGRHAVLGYAVLLLVAVAVAPQWLGWLPESALGGVLLAQGVQMVSPGLARTPFELLAGRTRAAGALAYDGRQRRLLWANWVVSIAVALSALLLGLGPAVVIGATLAVLLFVRANMRDVVRRSWTGEARRSLKIRTPAVAEVLRREGRRIALLELEGSLFFGTTDALRARLQTLAAGVDSVVLDLHQVNEVDVTAARILFEMAEDWSHAGRHLVFAEWSADDLRRRAVEAVAGPEGLALLRFADHADEALEWAEDRLLGSLGVAHHGERVLDLADAAIASTLDAEELALVREASELVHFERGDVIFSQGDPGDALFVSLRGEIGLRLPGGMRRLISFAPGVTMGEIAVLSHGTRTVDAVAESQVVALRLPTATFDRWKQERPVLAAKLLNNLALHLADRLRALTGDLAHWVSRSAAAHSHDSLGDGTGVADVEAQRAD